MISLSFSHTIFQNRTSVVGDIVPQQLGLLSLTSQILYLQTSNWDLYTFHGICRLNVTALTAQWDSQLFIIIEGTTKQILSILIFSFTLWSFIWIHWVNLSLSCLIFDCSFNSFDCCFLHIYLNFSSLLFIRFQNSSKVSILSVPAVIFFFFL